MADSAGAERIAVVIRIRPMNGKEQKAGEKIVVDYDEVRFHAQLLLQLPPV